MLQSSPRPLPAAGGNHFRQFSTVSGSCHIQELQPAQPVLSQRCQQLCRALRRPAALVVSQAGRLAWAVGAGGTWRVLKQAEPEACRDAAVASAAIAAVSRGEVQLHCATVCRLPALLRGSKVGSSQAVEGAGLGGGGAVAQAQL